MRFTLADCVGVNAAAFGQRVALEVIDPRRGTGTEPVEVLTFRDVWRRVVGLADALRPVEAGPNGPMVAILLPNGPDHAHAYLACQLVGAAAVPVNARLAVPEARYVVDDSGASVLLTGGELADLGAEVARAAGVEAIDVDDVPTPARATFDGPSGEEAGARRAVVGYTSGTTGFPKGTTWLNRDWLTRTFQWGWTFGLDPSQVHSVPGPMFHLSYGGLTVGSLAIGLRSRIMAAFDPAVALEEYTNHSTWVFLVPSMLAMIAEHRRQAEAPPAGALRVMLSSGAPGPLSLLEEAFELFPNARITEAYGWTEGGWVTYEVKDRASIVPHSVGWPMIGSEVRVVDPAGHPLGPGEPGEVVARTVVPFHEYLNQPEATAEALTDDGFVRSGDVGIWLDDGRLTIVDRVKDMIITGGENVYCAEVERVLHDHPDVAEAAVVGVADPTWGERVTAVVVPCPGATLEPQQLIDFARRHLAGYKCPKDVVVSAELPRNPMGKVQKFRLVEELAARPAR